MDIKARAVLSAIVTMAVAVSVMGEQETVPGFATVPPSTELRLLSAQAPDEECVKGKMLSRSLQPSHRP